MTKETKIILIILLCVTLVAMLGVGGWLAYDLGYCQPYADKIYRLVGDTTTLKVGIFSDSQLPASGDMSTRQVKTLRATLSAMKKSDIDVLIMAGDFTDLGTTKAWQSFKTVYDEVFGDDKPISSFTMGNHDYWLDYFSKCGEIGSPQKMKRRFTTYTGENPFSHKVINGYHFIAWSSNDGSKETSYNDEKWIKAQLDDAVAEDPTKPIFVTTHLNPEGTIYGSDDWGTTDITNMLKDYPQVISFSGHSHYALEDERSIYQGDFTAVNTQTIDYIEVEDDKYNNGIPVDAYGKQASYNPMGIIMTVTPQKVEMQRIAIDAENDTFTEEKAPWVISAPFGQKDKFVYTEAKRKANNEAPKMIPPGGIVATEKDIDDKDIKTLTFGAGRDDDFVHSYKVVFQNADGGVLTFDKTDYNGILLLDKNGKSESQNKLLYFSDFTLGIKKMSNTVKLRLPPNLPKGTARIEVTAIDSWGAESNPIYCDV